MEQQTIQSSYVLPLYGLSREDVRRAGSKAANLGELARAGFPVPEGFILTTEAFGRYLADNLLSTQHSRGEIAAAPLPADIAEALRQAVEPLDGAPLAVRSSGVAEDLEGASFAGQYETVLGVRGYEELTKAVRECWASAFSGRVRAYKSNKGSAIKSDGGDASAANMAVLVQKLVPADAAGVAFTANPVTGSREEVVVSAVRGLGERLVSGEASPDEWIVRGKEVLRQSAPEDAIDPEQARAVAALARQAENHFGEPQDVEWAIADGKVYMLQARPITTLPHQELAEPAIQPVPLAIDPPPGFWECDVEHISKPLSPMGRSVLLPSNTNGMRNMASTTGMLLEKIEFRDIGGWMYMRMVPLGGKDRPAPPPFVMKIMLRLLPQMRARLGRAREFIRNKEVDRLVERWYNEWYPEMTARNEALRSVDIARLPDAALEVHLEKALALLDYGNEIHFTLSAVNPFLMFEFVNTCRELLGWDEAATLSLVSGLSHKSTEPARRLAELAQMAKERPAIRVLIERPESSTMVLLAQVDPVFGRAFAAYQKDYGCRGLAFDLTEPTIAESPAMILGWIRDQIANDYDPAQDAAELEQKRGAAQARARRVLAGRPVQERQRFEQILARAARGYPSQEDNVFFTQNVPMALARYALLEMGRRLAQKAVIEKDEDIFFLEITEACQAFRQGGDLKALVLRRKGERLWAELHPGPATYGKQNPPPPLDALPPEERFIMTALSWYIERAIASGRGRVQRDGETITGIAASAGKYTGTVRVIHNEREFYKIQAGDVLVCPATTPAWSVLFSNVGALVTNTGGILSHPAIIAREYRVPAVVATGNATSILQDGQTVMVDGNHGTVEICK